MKSGEDEIREVGESESELSDPARRERDTLPPDYAEEDYYPPVIYHYFYGEGAYLGTILLLRACDRSPISDRTLHAMEGLRPFLVFALSDLVARHNCAKPISAVFHDVLQGIAWETKLTSRELQVLTLHMFGEKYGEIAQRLYISVDTVKKHVKKVHRKTGARSATELFARYFSPLIDLDLSDEGEKE